MQTLEGWNVLNLYHQTFQWLFFYIFLFIFAPINNVGGNLSKKLKSQIITDLYEFLTFNQRFLLKIDILKSYESGINTNSL